MGAITKDFKPKSCDELVSSISGKVLFQKDEAFEEARTAVWNLDSAGMPACIIKCKNATDVVAAIKFAKVNKKRICVHTAGAHSSQAVVDKCVTIDLSMMRSVSVDESLREATVEGGATIGDVDAGCKPYSLALPMGHVHHTGVAGMALNATSGVGFLCRSRSLTATFLKRVTLVTSDGTVKEVSEDENPELLWGMRGAGANFGIAVKMVFSLTKVAPTIFGGDVIKLGLGQGETDKTKSEIVQKWFELFSEAPVEAYSLLVLAPKGPVVTRLCYIPTEVDSEKPVPIIEKEANEVFKPYTSFGETMVNGTGMIDYWDGIQKMGEFGKSYYYQKASMIDIPREDFSDVADTLCAFSNTCPIENMGTGILLMPLGGNLHDLESDAIPTADVFNKMSWWIIIITEFPKGPEEPEVREKCLEWCREVYESIKPYRAKDKGRTKDYWSESIGEIYGSNIGRLKELKEQYDPTNLFSLNRNVSPK